MSSASSQASLDVWVPFGMEAERLYVIDVLLGRWLGLEYRTKGWNRPFYRIELGGGRALDLPDIFFERASARWLEAESLPDLPLARWRYREDLREVDLCGDDLPLLFAAPGPCRPSETADGMTLPIDVFGSAFYCLTRYEEAVLPQRDSHGRFAGRDSLAFQEGFLERPLVNEYLEVLWACMSSLSPGLSRRSRSFRVIPTHDVDQPFRHLFRTASRLAVNLTADLVSRGSPSLAWQNLRDWLAVSRGDLDRDPYQLFGYLMSASEARELRSHFYFISKRRTPIDGSYDLAHPAMLRLLGEIAERGHSIGLHASYLAVSDAACYEEERHLLDEALGRVGSRQRCTDVRHHVLRWEPVKTPRALAEGGLRIDSTLGYADRAGFRCGCCYELPVYDLAARAPLNLVERPLIAMECTVIEPRYMGLGIGAEALEYLLRLRRSCQRFDGDFVLLWHNNHLVRSEERELYEAVLDG